MVRNKPALSSNEAPTPAVVPASTSGTAFAVLSRTASARTTRSPPPVSVRAAPLPMKALLLPSASVAATAPEMPAIWMPVPEVASARSVSTPSPDSPVRTSMPFAVALPAIDAIVSDCWALTAIPAAMPTRLSTALALPSALESTSLVATTVSAPLVDVTVPAPSTAALDWALERLTPSAAALPCVW